MQLGMARALARKEFREAAHPRVPAGGTGGGQFTAAGAGADQLTTGELIAPPGGEASGVPTAAWRAASQALAQIVGPEGVNVQRTPNCVRAAPAVAAVLATMQAQGYRMPTNVLILADASPSGELRAETLQPRGGGAAVVTVWVPSSIPADVSLDDATRAAFHPPGGDPSVIGTTVTSFAEIVVHEMGHVVNGITRSASADAEMFADALGVWVTASESDIASQLGDADQRANTWPKVQRVRDTARLVSEYAYKNPSEFLAETFVRLYRHDVLEPRVHALYQRLNGKYPRDWSADDVARGWVAS